MPELYVNLYRFYNSRSFQQEVVKFSRVRGNISKRTNLKL